MGRPSNYEDRHPQDRNEERLMPLSDINDLDAVVHELGIQDSTTTPAEAVRELNQEIVELHQRLASDITAEREAIANKAREFAVHYPEGSDGRNTFIILAEWIEARQ